MDARRSQITRALNAGLVCLILAVSSDVAGAQPAPRRLTTIAALRHFPGFYHLQNVLVHGEFTEQNGTMMLHSDDGDVRVVIDDDRVRTISGAAEVRGQLIDVGRLEPADPRLPEKERRDRERWPRPGEELFVRVTAVASATPASPVSLRALTLEPWRYDGQKVTVTGNFRGRNLFGDLPGAPGKSRYDFVIRGTEGAVWVTGMRPRGRGFDLDIDRRVDSDQWLEVTGTVAHENGLVRIEAAQLVAAKAPALVLAADEPPAPPPVLPPLEVVFSSPTPGEMDVNTTTVIRIQFSRGIDTRTIAGAIRVGYVGGGGTPPGFQTSYDAATRSLTLRFASPLEPSRTVQVEVVDTLKAFDGAPSKPWMLTFSVGL